MHAAVYHDRACRTLVVILGALLCALTTCATPTPQNVARLPESDVHLSTPLASVKLLNRVTWGANDASARQHTELGTERFLAMQLHPVGSASLPAPVQAQIDAMTIVQRPPDQLVVELEQRRKEAEASTNDDDKKAAQQVYQQELNRVAREAATRALLRALYAPNQLQEQMTWFWMNHFNIFQYKRNLRALVSDYEDRAIRPHALGRFRNLLAATVHHPAMLRYLDNEQNAVGRINENYARELLELHTLGVHGGYSQAGRAGASAHTHGAGRASRRQHAQCQT